MKKRILNTIIFSIILVLLLGCLFSCDFMKNKNIEDDPEPTIKDEQFEEKMPLNLDANMDYDDNSLLVFMDKSLSEPSKEWSTSFFKNEHIIGVYCLNPNLGANSDGYRQILKIVMDEHSKDLVLEVARDIYKIKGVYSVDLNYVISIPELPGDAVRVYAITLNYNQANDEESLKKFVATGEIIARIFPFDIERDGYIFRGWECDGQVIFDENQQLITEIELREGLEFIAIWEEIVL